MGKRYCKYICMSILAGVMLITAGCGSTAETKKGAAERSADTMDETSSEISSENAHDTVYEEEIILNTPQERLTIKSQV